ncbi:similar to Saccharomyces cerevisiae YGR031W IMO32 Conserved mitochondrial protein of unknown function [Maudiozyma saulgeensis]|uniref:AB hydrolase-1 domain-containing protein n=1 Tax=Maudiozyma saulgeensis TaxID=1789683 RepID=A0A1X7R9Y8_9SACH|nr:similar to Saccharomyces cerevisiae YGR031W IMO32 Conserved mitochondrial protein of unknown function [Kazachstania saulgeensis]
MFKFGVQRAQLSGSLKPNITFNVVRFQCQAVKLSYDLLTPVKNNSGNLKKNPLVIMHGLLGNKMNNRTLGRLLRDKLDKPVYLVDLRNHGASPHISPHNYDSMSGDILKFIKEHELEDPILIGHSMGAKVGMECVLKDKESASILVCLDNAPIFTAPNGKYVQYITKLQQICATDNIHTLNEADKLLSTIESNKFIRGFLLTVLKRTKNDQGQWQFISRMPLDIIKDAVIKGNISGWSFDSHDHRWCKPTLFIRGTESIYIADEYIPVIGLFFPCFEIRDIKAGHYLNATNPEECADLIAEFVNKNVE